jgi:NAD dependent epimerase/dehydratase
MERSAYSWGGRHVLVTGAGGFIGSHLVEALVRAGASVRAFVRYNSRNDYGWLESCAPEVAREIAILRGDLVNPEAVGDSVRGSDCVMHLGALIAIPYSYQHPREFVLTNTVGTMNVLEAARRSEVSKVVHVSTSEVYGTPLSVPIDETHGLNAQSPYAASKIGADQLALSYQASFDLPVVIARPFNTYGPRQSARAVIPTIVVQALARGEIELGSTHPTRDFVYVEDTVRGLVRCAEVDGIEGAVINLGSGTETSIAALSEAVLSELGVEKPVRSVSERVRPPRSELQRLVADSSKARSLLNWSSTISLAEGLRRTIEWFGSSIEAYKPSIYNL